MRWIRKVKVWGQCHFGVWVFEGWSISWVSYNKRLSLFYFSQLFVLLFMLLDQISACFHLSRINNDKFIAVKKNIRFNHESKSYSPTHLLSTLPKRVNQNSFTENERIQSKMRVAAILLEGPDYDFHWNKNKMISFKESVSHLAFLTLSQFIKHALREMKALTVKNKI